MRYAPLSLLLLLAACGGTGGSTAPEPPGTPTGGADAVALAFLAEGSSLVVSELSDGSWVGLSGARDAVGVPARIDAATIAHPDGTTTAITYDTTGAVKRVLLPDGNGMRVDVLSADSVRVRFTDVAGAIVGDEILGTSEDLRTPLPTAFNLLKLEAEPQPLFGSVRVRVPLHDCEGRESEALAESVDHISISMQSVTSHQRPVHQSQW